MVIRYHSGFSWPDTVMNQLEQLRQHTTVVADTGDFASVVSYRPTDATTNPSLVLAAAQMPEYEQLLAGVLRDTGAGRLNHQLDTLAVTFGCEMLQLIPGRISTEVDARLSFDTAGSVARAEGLIALYEARGVARERVLIKLAATWEGIEAARLLEQQGIHCNLTLLFGFGQAVACAEAGVTLISPFVGRIFDWYKQAEGVDGYPADADPGVLSVTRIYNYFKKFGYSTQVMGASFRNVGEILALAGCDLLTIAPKFLDALAASDEQLTRRLSRENAQSLSIERVVMNEAQFRWMMNEDAMATEKLAEGIRNFSRDLEKLEAFVAQKNRG